MDVIEAQAEHLDALSVLLDRYRQFYGKASDLASAESFVRARLAARDAVFLIARVERDQGDLAAGFAQLFSSFSTVAGTRILLLGDLYVQPSLRRQGVGRALIRKAKQYAQSHRFSGIKLDTQDSNRVARALYESEGFQELHGVRQYFLPLSEAHWLTRFFR
ncbi:MAG: GNAT family N-acetyltransferase [Pseudomonadota bacterium]